MGLDYETVESASNEANIISAAVKFRDEIRENAKSDFKKILEICDKFRDYEMVDLNIRLEDKKVGEPAVWKFDSKDVLIAER
jgi:cysteinyl-tRNA synthetase